MDATRPPPPPRILVYDGDCSLCIAVSRRLLRWTRRGEETRRAAQAFEGEDAERIAASQAHNELAVMDPTTKELRSGVDGLLWWLEGSRLAWLARLLSWGPLRWAAGVVYPVIAYNRRILAPPKPRAVACACDPDPRPGATIALGSFALTVLGGALVAVAAVVAAGSPAGEAPRPIHGLEHASAAAAWAAVLGIFAGPTLLLVAVLRPAGARLLHAAAFLWSAALCAPLLLLGVVVGAAVGSQAPSGLGAIAFGVTFQAAYRRRLRHLGASGWWFWVWGGPLLLAAVLPGLMERLRAG